MRLAMLLPLLLLSLLPVAAQAQTLPSEAINKEMPRWIRIGFDHRFRLEGYTNFRYQDGNDDRRVLSRLRASLTLHPSSWLCFNFQGQDSRIFFKSNPSGQTPYLNRFDLRQGYAEFGKAGKSAIAFRFGRQELAYGDERIVGAGNWGSTARTFDAAKLMLKRGPWQVDLVSASVVLLLPNGLSHHSPGNNLHFVYAKWTNPVPKSVLEPYFLWRAGKGLGDALGGIQHQDRHVAGVRFAGTLSSNWDYNLESILQTGTVVDPYGKEQVRAFAQHAAAGRTFAAVAWNPRLFGEFNYASGDRDPLDHRSGTFDQIYPTPHAKYGLADQVGWQNIEHMAGGLDLTPHKGLAVRVSVNDWRLAQVRDGVYAAGGALLFRDTQGKSGRHVGEEIDITVQYTHGPHYIGAGYGHLFPGGFLQAQSPGAGLNYQYLNAGYRF